jgi:sarcosine oxidase subunit gamma
MPVFVPEPLEPGRYGAADGEPVRISRVACTLVQVVARRDGAAALAEALHTTFGLSLPPPGHAATAGALRALWMQPQGWLIQAPADADAGLPEGLARACAGVASVVEQSDGRAVFILAGAQARAVLARLCRLDLHPRVFAVGQVAATPLGGLAALLHQTGAAPAYEMIVAASYARAFGRMLASAAAPLGYEVV